MSEEALFRSPLSFLQDWSADGRFVAYALQDTRGNFQLWVLPLFGDRKPFPFLENGANNYYARFSPDGRSIGLLIQ